MKQATVSAASVLILGASLTACTVDDQQSPSAAKTNSLIVPDTQMVIVQIGSGGPKVLHYQEVPVLEPGEGEVLVKVVAAAINPINRRSREGARRVGRGVQARRRDAARQAPAETAR